MLPNRERLAQRRRSEPSKAPGFLRQPKIGIYSTQSDALDALSVHYPQIVLT